MIESLSTSHRLNLVVLIRCWVIDNALGPQVERPSLLASEGTCWLQINLVVPPGIYRLLVTAWAQVSCPDLSFVNQLHRVDRLHSRKQFPHSVELGNLSCLQLLGLQFYSLSFHHVWVLVGAGTRLQSFWGVYIEGRNASHCGVKRFLLHF